MVTSVNQLSLYGAVADLIKEVPDGQRAPGKHTEDTALKLKFHLYSKIKPLLGLELWTGLRSALERQCRSKKKKELRETAAKATKKTSNWNLIPKRSKDPYCFQMSKFITQLFRHKEVGREEDAGFLMIELLRYAWKFYQRIQDFGQTN